MDWGWCAGRDRCGKTASSGRRDSNHARAGRYEKCWKGGINNLKAQEIIWRDVEYYRRQSDQFCKLQRWAGRETQGRWWRRYRALQAERRWRTRLGDGHTLPNSTAVHGEFAAKADEAWGIDATGLGGIDRLLLWGRYEVLDGQIEDSGSC